MHANARELLLKLPAPEPGQPPGERFLTALRHGTMSVEFYAPVGADNQTPHRQDELYFVHSGVAELRVAGEVYPALPGAVLFVPAGVEHRFENFSQDFSTWAVFWGPDGGE